MTNVLPLVVVPARIGSSRLPGKPLRLLWGKPLILQVVRRLRRLGSWEVVVATDSTAVEDAVGTAALVVRTRAGHRNGTERTAEVAALPGFGEYQTIINVQGDQPLLPVGAILHAVAALRAHDVGTVAARLSDRSLGRERVKVAFSTATGSALSFSRRAAALRGVVQAPDVCVGEHLGVYAYRRAALAAWAKLPPADDELLFGLEQLRPMAHGMRVGVRWLSVPAPITIDTEEDLAAANENPPPEAYAP